MVVSESKLLRLAPYFSVRPSRATVRACNIILRKGQVRLRDAVREPLVPVQLEV
jgi:hypothetical protein